MALSDYWLKASEACVYIRSHYGIYMDLQKIHKLRKAGYFEWKQFPGQWIRVSKHSLDSAYGGPYEAVADTEKAEAEPPEAA
ncbi:hypothetical protein SAMN05444161_3177 [Rhizobiales bacterium GAS191]|nr:hypothetical protein SAMN05444161_3177 [Rhizobiales bacterium GAS191]